MRGDWFLCPSAISAAVCYLLLNQLDPLVQRLGLAWGSDWRFLLDATNCIGGVPRAFRSAAERLPGFVLCLLASHLPAYVRASRKGRSTIPFVNQASDMQVHTALSTHQSEP